MSKIAVFSNSFLKNLKKLDQNKKEIIKNKLKQLLLDPNIGIPLKGDLKPLWKFRIGKFRIIYKFDSKKIYFITLDLRKRVYKK